MADVTVIKKVQETPVPSDPLHFRGRLMWCQVDDTTGRPTAQVEHVDDAGVIALRPTVSADGNTITLVGQQDPHAHPFNQCAINAHTNGMTFQIMSLNRNTSVYGKVLMKRSFDRSAYRTFLSSSSSSENSTEITFKAVCYDVPLQVTCGEVTIYIRDATGCKGRRTIDRVAVVMSRESYDLWIETMQQ